VIDAPPATTLKTGALDDSPRPVVTVTRRPPSVASTLMSDLHVERRRAEHRDRADQNPFTEGHRRAALRPVGVLAYEVDGEALPALTGERRCGIEGRGVLARR
jgi:hypothetical protein